MLLPGGLGAEWAVNPPLLLGALLLAAWPPREAGPELLDGVASSEDSLLFRFWLEAGLLAAANFSMRFSAIFE
jgi:hypothetical protein